MKKDPKPKTASARQDASSASVPAVPLAAEPAGMHPDQRFRILFDTMTQGVVFRDATGRVISANPAAERIIGISLADLQGRTSAEAFGDAVHEDGTPVLPDDFPAEQALRTSLPITGFVFGFRRPGDADHRWISVNATPIARTGEPKPFLVYILFEDITERRAMTRSLHRSREQLEMEVQDRTRMLTAANEELSAQIAIRRRAEEALRESEEKFRRLAENAADLIYLYRIAPERGFEYVSPSATAITGYTPEEHYADPGLGLQIVHPDDRKRLLDMASGRRPGERLVLRWIRKDGRLIWIELRNLSIRDASGRIVALQGIARDISDRIAIEEKLRASERFLQTIIETEPECVKMLAADGSILMMNAAGLAMIDAGSLDQVRGTSIYPLIDPRYRQDAVGLTERVFRGGTGTLAFPATGLRGRKVWLETHAVPLRDDAGTIIALLAVTRDITARKTIEERLVRSEASLAEAQGLAGIGSWVRDIGSDAVQWSPEVFRILGRDPVRTAATFDAFRSAIHPGDREHVARALASALNQREPYDIDFRVVRSDGTVRFVHSKATVVLDEAGAPRRLVGTLQDLTERRRTEELLPRIAERVSEKTGDDYFRTMVEFIVRELDTAYAFVGSVLPGGTRVRTIAVYAHDRHAENFEYDLNATPCDMVVGRSPCYYPSRVQSLFPHDTMLTDMGIDSYAGIPLFATSGEPLGLIVTMGTNPMRSADRERTLSLLKLFSGRSSAELERRRTEESLRQGEQRYRQLLESVTSYLYTVQVENGAAVSTAHGAGCAAVTGYAAEEYAADPSLWLRMVHDDDRAAVLEQIDRVLRGEETKPLEHRIRHKSGALIWIRSTVVPQHDAQGRLVAYDGVIVDITDRRQADEFARNILESVDESFIVIDRTYRIMTANRAFSDMTGKPLGEIIGKNCYEISHRILTPCHEHGEDCAVRNAFQTGEPAVAVHSHHDRDGNPIIVETKAFPLKNESGEVIAAIEIQNNITDKRRLEDQLRHAQKMEAVGLLAGGIAHDFNNILTAIVGYGNLLKMKMPASDPLSPYVEQVLGAATRAAGLTRSLLAFSRKQVINPCPLDLNDAIRRIDVLLRRIIGEDIELRIDVMPGKLTIMADSSQLEQVLMNLATNARDAMPQGGRLTIATGTMVIGEEFRRKHGFGVDGSYATVMIEDNGIGMSSDVRARIFEPFFTTKELGRGTGLGLAIVYGIMKQNNGYITVESEPGTGTLFRLHFPLVLAPEKELMAEEHSRPVTGQETILIAEDDPAIRQLTRTLLSEFGYRVVEAADGEEAVRRFRDGPDDIQMMILDVVMPKKNGREVREEIVRLRPDARILFISGYNAEVLRAKGFTDGIENVIQKPVSPMDLLRAVRQTLDRPAPPRPLGAS